MKSSYKIGALLSAALLLVLGLYAFTDWLPDVSALGAALSGGGALMAQTLMVPTEVKEALAEIKDGIAGAGAKTTKALERLEQLTKEHEALQRELDSLRRSTLMAGAFKPDISRGKFVSDSCARFLASIAIVGAEKNGKLTHLKSDRETVLKGCFETLGLEQRAALTTADIPLPTNYRAEVVELIWEFGQARKYAMVVPLSGSSNKLPRLKTSPAFGFITQSAPLDGKSPQIEWVTMNPEKAGGIVRIPSEIDADSIVALGQFIARYIATEMARFEDTVLFAADGTATYKGMSGVGLASITLGKSVLLGAGKTAPSDVSLADFRALRRQVSTAALGRSAYYLNLTWESRLVAFNTSANGQVYVPNGANGATLDGFQIRWVDVLPVYGTDPNAGAIPIIFGAMEYQALGIRSGLTVDTSSEVYFETDEIGVRALERLVIGRMADDALAALKLAAA